MSFTVVSVGGPLAPEGEALIVKAGGRVVSTGPYPARADLIALLASEQPDAIVVRVVEKIDADVMRASPRLKLIAKHGAGTNDIDVEAAAALGLPVIAAVGANAHSVAEHALALLLALAKDIRTQDAFVRGGGWEKRVYKGFELRGRTLGLVGLGMIGRSFAAMVQPLGMTVFGYDPFAAPEAFGPHVERVADLDDMLGRCDVISLHCPLTPQTEGLINARALGLMKPGSLLINTARGEVVDEEALVAALKNGPPAGAGLDSFAHEPPSPTHPLWSLPNVILSPHIGGVTEDARRQVSTMTATNVAALLTGQTISPHFYVKPKLKA